MTSKAGLDSNGHDNLISQSGLGNASIPGVEEEEEDRDNRARMADIMMQEEEQNDATLDSLDKNEADEARMQEETTLPPLDDAAVSVFSGPDDTPSIQGSVVSTPSSIPASKASFRSRQSPSPHPFERRFKARIISGSTIPRALSPAFLQSHSRQSSVSSQLTLRSQDGETHEPAEDRNPWDVVRWTRLKKITQQAFSESGKRAFGRPTVLCISASIALGTSKGIILLFDYQQTLKAIIGQGTPAAECGSITSLAISADHTTVVGGHANGSIFTWDLSRPARPFLHIPPLNHTQLANRSEDGHVADCAILHVGFLGQRHTALVSADESGMAFSHLATRGLGSVGRMVKTTRVLGRYPDRSTTRKPSSVLAFAPLPLGNIEQTTDDFGLTALLTPYLLVIVSTTPIAQTQHKAPRLKDIAAHSALTGCLAWFPTVKLKDINAGPKEPASKTRLVYCWSNILNVLEVHERRNASDDPHKRPELEFRSCGRWTCEEAILAVQWLSRSTIAVLTITQRMIILDGTTLRVADHSDLNPKHIYHEDLFSRRLQPLVDKIDQGDGSMHGVLPDAHHMSFKAYKGRLFLLGMSDVSMGTLSNWADRLVATMEAGSPIAAIELATSYYTGNADKVTIGLPDDDRRRHDMVKDKLLELLSSSLQYILNDETNRETEQSLRTILEDFARVCFNACILMKEIDFLFDQVYEKYSDASMQDIFFYEAEPYIVDGRIDVMPPGMLQDLLTWYEIHGFGTRIEEIICSLQTSTLDIDQVSGVCRRMGLYDALIYVWNEALDDFVTPLTDLMSLIPQTSDEGYFGRSQDSQAQVETAMKMFPYMAYTLTGRRYPSGDDLNSHQSIKGRASMYGFLFAGRTVQWPRGQGKVISAGGDEEDSKAYPYIRRLLHFDSFSLLSMLNEAFEDSFLNGEEQTTNGSVSQDLLDESYGMTINRQRIVNILLEIVTSPEFEPEDKILLDIFLARNLAKFQFLQYILLSGTVMHRILVELCNNPIEDFNEECILSVEYLLTVYKPPDLQELISMLTKARYYRILKSTYRSSKQYAKWLETHFDDPDGRHAVFSGIADCLRTNAGLSKRQVQEVKAVILSHARELCGISVIDTAKTLQIYADDLLDPVYTTLDETSLARYTFLHTLLEPQDLGLRASQAFRTQHQEDYVRLMCRHDRQHVSDYVSLLESGNLNLASVLPSMEENGIVDAAVILLQHDGLARDAMDRLLKHLEFLKLALSGLLDIQGDADPDRENTEEAVDDLLQQMQRYVKLGVWLCQGEGTRTSTTLAKQALHKRGQQKMQRFKEDDLTPVEMLWLDLIEATISVHRLLPDRPSTADGLDNLKSEDTTSTFLRDLVQNTFTSLLAATTIDSSPVAPALSLQPKLIHSTKQTPRFPALLSTLLTRLSHTSSAPAVLPLLSTLFASYAFESSILTIARQFLDKDVFALVSEIDTIRRRGWKPLSRACEVCGKRCWGPGAGQGAWEAWDEKRIGRRLSRGRDVEQERGRSGSSRAGKGKQRAVDGEEETERQDALVIFSCGHLFHRTCLEKEIKTKADEGVGKLAGMDVDEVGFVCTVCE